MEIFKSYNYIFKKSLMKNIKRNPFILKIEQNAR